MKYDHLKLQVLDGRYKYLLFERGADIKDFFEASPAQPIGLFKSADELSAIVPFDMEIPGTTKVEPDWICMRIVGEMPFGTVQGLIAEISGVLAENKMGICVVSTFLTDWFFVKSKNIELAVSALKKIGWKFVE